MPLSARWPPRRTPVRCHAFANLRPLGRLAGGRGCPWGDGEGPAGVAPVEVSAYPFDVRAKPNPSAEAQAGTAA